MNTLNTLKCMKCAAVLVPALVLGMPLANAMIGSDLDGQSTDQRAMASDRSGMHASAHNGYLNALPARGYHSDSLIGAEVKNRRNDETIGKVSNLALDEDGQVIAVIVGVGGLMSIGERDVAIAWDRIERKADGDDIVLTVDLTEDSLKSAPRYPGERSEKAVAVTGLDRANQRVDQRTGQGADKPAGKTADRPIGKTADKRTAEAADKRTAMAADKRAVQSPDQHTTGHKAHYVETMPVRGYHSDSLIGKEVVNRRNDESVGNVSNLVLDENGQVVAVIISVGGILGLGARDVAISWDQIERKVAGDEVTLSIDMTEEALKDAPKYSSDRKDSRDPTTTRR